MKIKNIQSELILKYLQVAIYLFINILFILKYLTRTSVPSTLFAIIFTVLIIILLGTYQKKQFSQKTYKYLTYGLLSLTIFAIIFLLSKINPHDVRVDRWSATTFFIDGLFHREYPYGIHTHVSETNFPSPFPAWHYINIPFYLLGDVGIGLIFFLLLAFLIIIYFTKSYRLTFLFLLLLILSPAYWWEVSVRSDSLSNAILVFAFIVFFILKKYTLNQNFILAVLCCGIIASTRLSAILPAAIFFFSPYLKLSWKKKILFPIIILIILGAFFIPYVFWDTTNWIFFKRNPFMSQTSIGNTYLLLLMMVLGIIMALKWKSTSQYFQFTSIFMFIFMLVSFLGIYLMRGVSNSFFDDPYYDISYFNLGIPYTITSMVLLIRGEKKLNP